MSLQWLFEDSKSFEYVITFIVEVNLQNFRCFDKYELVNFSAFLEISLSEEELHANLFKLREIFENNSLVKLEFTLRIFPENEQLVDFLLLHHKILSGHNSQVGLIQILAHSEDLIRLSCLGLEKSDRNLTILLESVRIDDEDLINSRDKDLVGLCQIEAFTTFIVVVKNWHSERVDELSSVDGERFLVGLVSDTVSDSRTEHHLVAPHEVEHDVLQSWLEGLWIDEIEVDLVVSGNLDTLVSLDEVDETSDIKLVILLPELVDLVWVVLILLFDDFEKHDLTGRPGDESFVVNEIHLSEILIGHLLELCLLSIITTNDEGFSLSVEGVDFVVVSIVETLVWEVLG